MKTYTYRFPVGMSDDTRLAELFHEAERKRIRNRINWAAVAALTALLVIDGSLIASAIRAWVKFR